MRVELRQRAENDSKLDQRDAKQENAEPENDEDEFELTGPDAFFNSMEAVLLARWLCAPK